MSIAKQNKWTARQGRILALSFLFPLAHFVFPFLHRELQLLNYSDEFYFLFGYCKTTLLVLQLILCITGLASGIGIYRRRRYFSSGHIPVLACLLRCFPAMYIVLMLLFVRLYAPAMPFF